MPDQCHCQISVTVHCVYFVGLYICIYTQHIYGCICCCDWISSISYNLPPCQRILEHSPEALAARPGALRPHVTRAWFGPSKDEIRDAAAPVGYGWVEAISYALGANPASVYSVELRSFVAWF